MENNLFREFIGLYKRSITLRASLIPQGKTRENIEKDKILEKDEHRADSYVEAKRIIDSFHKHFMEKALTGFVFDEVGKAKKGEEASEPRHLLQEYYQLYTLTNKNDDDKKALEEIQDSMRKLLVASLEKDSDYNSLFAKELITQLLPAYIDTEAYAQETMKRLTQEGKQPDAQVLERELQHDRNVIQEFNKFTTYFTGFHENRENIYKAEAKHSALSFRMIDENLPRFIDNMAVFAKISNSAINEQFPALAIALQDVLPVASINEVFSLNYYNRLVTQSQIEVYNTVIGGRTLEDGVKIKGLNEYVNLYNQQQKDKRLRLPKFTPLYKQILSDRNALSWLPEAFQNDDEMLKAIENCYHNILNEVLTRQNESNTSLTDLLSELESFDLNLIYLPNDEQLTHLSQMVCGDWSIIKKAVIAMQMNDCTRKKNESDEKYNERIEKLYSSTKLFSIAYLNTCLEAYCKQINEGEDAESRLTFIPLHTYFIQTIHAENNMVDAITTAHNEAKHILTDGTNTPIKNEEQAVEKIKNLLDSIKRLQKFIKPLLAGAGESEKDERFYAEITSYWDMLNIVTPLYNMVRSYVTSKPYTVDKIKLNFENSTLMNGWDLSKEADNTSILMRKDGNYYLAIMPTKYNKSFTKLPEAAANDEVFEKMEYKLLPGANKMLPKVFFSKSRIDEFAPSASLVEHYKAGTHKKGAQFNLQHCHELIDFFKASIAKHPEWKNFNFNFSPTESYDDLSMFYREVEAQGYKLTFRKVPASYINQLVNDGKLYLFQIYNKDFSTFSKGTPNLHTLYWKMLFDSRNLEDVVFKLNGQGEVFYRKASLNYNRPTHPAGTPIANKNPLNKRKESNFDYNLTKDKRYTQEHFEVHIPITMNFKSTGGNNINALAQNAIRQHKDVCVIGLDRGERHLIYLTVVDAKGQIKEQYSLNEIVNEYNGNTYRTNYRDLLKGREGERDAARKNWKTIEGIAEMKEGYLSQVVHKIAQLMVKYNAIVVLEDLNFGFKRGRQKVERQVYQKFEKMLIDKLNYMVVDKRANPFAEGGVLKGYQLASKFDSFERLGKQSGFLFYVDAWNTSKIDPKTGFVNMLDTSYTNVATAQSFFSKFDFIRYNQQDGWFEFAFDYSNFGTKAAETRERWTLCTQGTRIITFRNPAKNSEWDNKEINLTAEFQTFFSKYGINMEADDLQEQIIARTDKPFFEGLLHLVKLTLQMRNSVVNSDEDYLLSPIKAADGKFYDSRTCDESLPKNADANGAYNIARKGLLLIDKIRNNQPSAKGKKDGDNDKLSLAISHKEWLQYAQKHHE